MKKIIALVAILGLGFVALAHADMTPTANTTPMVKKAAHKHHKHHAKKAMAPAAAAATSGTAK